MIRLVLKSLGKENQWTVIFITLCLEYIALPWVSTTDPEKACFFILYHSVPFELLSHALALLLMFSHLVMSDSLQPHELQHARLPCPSPTPGACSNSCSLSQWCHPTISPSVIPFSLPQHQDLFQWVGSSHQVVKVLKLQHQSLQWIFRVDSLYDGQVWFLCSPRDSQESSPASQFESINSLVLNLPYGASHIHIWLLEKPQLWLYRPLSAMSLLFIFNTLSSLSKLFFQGASVF